MAKYQLARYGKVWQSIKEPNKKIGRRLELKEGDSLLNYRQVAAPKPEEKEAQPQKATTRFTPVDAEPKNDSKI